MLLLQWVVMQQQDKSFQESGDVVIATFMLGAFVFGAVLQDDVDDDDDNGPSSGIMIPLQIPV